MVTVADIGLNTRSPISKPRSIGRLARFFGMGNGIMQRADQLLQPWSHLPQSKMARIYKRICSHTQLQLARPKQVERQESLATVSIASHRKKNLFWSVWITPTARLGSARLYSRRMALAVLALAVLVSSPYFSQSTCRNVWPVINFRALIKAHIRRRMARSEGSAKVLWGWTEINPIRFTIWKDLG